MLTKQKKKKTDQNDESKDSLDLKCESEDPNHFLLDYQCIC